MAKTSILAAAAALALGVSVTGTAHADAWANAQLNVSNFTLLNGGTAFNFATDFTSLTFTDSTTLTAQAGGFPISSLTNTTGGFGGLPLATVCSGPSCPTDPFAPPGPPPAGYSSAAGSALTGVPITVGASAAGADAKTAAFSQAMGNGTGAAQGGLTLSSSIIFSLGHSASSVSMSFDAGQILKAYTAMPALASATAGNTLSFILRDITPGGPSSTIFRWAPDGTTTGGVTGSFAVTANGGGCTLQGTANANVPPVTPTLDDESCSGSYAGTVTAALDAGRIYSFGITQQSNTSVVSIPEPSSVLLAGLALVGLGVAAGRRNRKV